jgi:hypothetical protein
MKEKAKAKELILKYKYNLQYALIAVNELINCTLPSCDFGGEINNNTIEYWKKVKKEINNYERKF